MAKKNVQISAEGLESSVDNVAVNVETAGNVNYSDREYLEKNAPEFLPEFISKKYDAEREPKVQDGLKAVQELLGNKINPLIILLAKWWEVKPARAAIKKMIDAEAAEKNQPEDVYLQLVLRENVDKLSTISQAVDRMAYSITYFKPRAGVSAKEVTKVMTIDGAMYNVSMTKLAEAKATFGEDKESLKAYLKEVSTKVDIEEIL
jgi:hypothetical protein